MYPGESFTGLALAEKLGEGVRPVQKRLSGTQPMTLADVLTLAAMFGDNVLNALPREIGGLFPAEYQPLLTRWNPGEGVPPRFADFDGGPIDWQRSLDDLAAYGAAARVAQRGHLLTAETYRYELALTLAAQRIPLNRAENGSAPVERSALLTLFEKAPLTIVVCDLRLLGSRATAAATLIRIIYQTVECSDHDRVLVLVADDLAMSQIEVHIPEVVADPSVRFNFAFQRAATAGFGSGESDRVLPDLELEGLGHASSGEDQHMIALRVGK
jgi:hypothetical protein